MLISKSIPNLINGVSQQPAEVRLPSQADEQLNFLSSVVEGLKRRPGTKYIADLMTDPASGAYVHIINRDKFEKYVAVFIDGDVRVFDFQGNERTVTKPNGTTYLTCFDPRSALRAVTVADYTFVLNRERIARAYDPMAGIDLQPVMQRFQAVTFTIPSAAEVKYNYEYWFKEYLMESIPGRTLPVTYTLSVAGAQYSIKIEDLNLQRAVQYFANVLSTALNRPCIARGHILDIPLNAGEAAFSISESSTIPNLTNSPPVDSKHHYVWKVVNNPYVLPYYQQGSKRVSTISSGIVERVVGYASPNGDIIPEGEIANREGIVHVRQGDYGSSYTIYINGTSAATLTTGSTNRNEIGTDVIASNLYNQLQSKAATFPNLVFTLKGNVIRIRASDPSYDFTLTTADSGGGKHLIACKGRVQSFTDLPATCFEGFSIKVAGQDGIEADDYYVQYTELNEDGEKTTGTWKEVAKKGLRTRPAPATMPHRLVSNPDGTFTFEHIEWDGRVAGDENSAPEPSFVNKSINDVFFFKNRLGFLADENIIFSEAGSYYNFYPTTVIQALDTHPIDVAVTNDKVSILRHAVPFNEQLLLFSDQTQFILKGSDRLTRETVNIDVTTRFEASLEAKPVGAGKNVFFGVRRGSWSGVREYYVDPDTQVNDAADIASHCPEYIYGSIVSLAASSNEDMVLALTDTAPDTLYAYKYYWQGNEKVQSSWSKWQLGGNILGYSFIDSDIAVVVDRGGQVVLEMLSLAEDGAEEARGFKTSLYLDRKTFVEAGEPFPWTSDTQIAIDQKGNVISTAALRERFPGNVADIDLYLGERFKSYYRFSPLVLTDGDTRIASLVGRLQLRFMTLNYVDSGFFTVGVRSSTRPAITNSFVGRRIGSDANRLGAVPIDSGRYRFPILGQAHETSIWIESESHLPCSFLSAEWEALFNRHSRRA